MRDCSVLATVILASAAIIMKVLVVDDDQDRSNKKCWSLLFSGSRQLTATRLEKLNFVTSI